MGTVKAAIDHMVKRGTKHCDMPWDDLERSVIQVMEGSTAEWVEPDDFYWALDHYTAKKGHPSTNGLGHLQVTKDGKEYVIVPGDRGWDTCTLLQKGFASSRPRQPLS